LCLIGPRIFGPRAVRAGYKFRTEQAALASTIEEQISAQPVIKAFGLRDMVKSGTRDQAARVVASASRSSVLSSCMDGARGARGKSGISAKGSGAAMYPAFKMQPLWPLALM
jgi:ATP-binding cassette subfamily B protein